MSFAFGALLIVLLLLPGIAFRYAYIRSNSLRRSLDFSLLSETIIMILVALLLHAIGMGVARSAGFAPDFRLVYLLGTGGVLETADFVAIEKSYLPFVGYVLLLCGTAALLGYGLQRIVLDRGYDQQYKGLRVLNDWDRYFTGYVLPAPLRSRLNFIWVDLLVDGSAGNAVLYSGVLENYSLNREQVIDQIFISSAIRRHNPDLSGAGYAPPPGRRQDQAPNYDLPGDYLVIPFSQVRNLNIIYNFLQQVDPEDEPLV